ncbi:hypothetical protein TIFTF001_012097 [Ficus carica]|uniref:Uncharacterized protein n=1 Tax=Ficus carica TaxID=3494 RepID=A0AA87ZVE0_FICCA|nr:hypothetical protein TIFTF001_012097 [Ficus carica]
MGGSEAEPEGISTPKLPLFSIKQHNMASPEHPGMLTPPYQTSLSVPFRWEEKPGKPRPCLALATVSTHDMTPKSLELPPRLLSETRLLSPTTVLEGPYVGSQRFQSSSFRISSECYGYGYGYGGSFSPESGSHSLRAMVLITKKSGFKVKSWLGCWRRRVLLKGQEVSGGSYVFPSSVVDRESDDFCVEESSNIAKAKKTTKIRRGSSFSSLTNYTRSHFWGTICEGLKQAVPWKNKKLKRGGL